MAHFRTAHPEVEFQLSLAEQADALFALRSNRVDLAIVLLDLVVDGIAGGKPPLDDGLQWRSLWDDPYTVVVPRSHAVTDVYRRRRLAIVGAVVFALALFIKQVPLRGRAPSENAPAPEAEALIG